MKTKLSHIQFNVRPDGVPFYRDLFGFLGWQPVPDDEGTVGVEGPAGESLWFLGIAADTANHYDGCGMNHVAIGAESVADVDAVADFLRQRAIGALFETPHHRPDFTATEDETYYQVMFESPDRILFEVVYAGPKAA